MKIWVDPTYGHRYGFPKIYDTETDGAMPYWLVKNGLPIELLDFPIRQWVVVETSYEHPDQSG